MDLSKLSKDLPPTTNIQHISVPRLNAELTDQFKNAAKSVTSLYNATNRKDTCSDGGAAKVAFSTAAKAVASLYRLGTEHNVLLMHKGYLDCLDDLLQVLSNDGDMENWILTKRAELLNYYNQKEVVRDPLLGSLLGPNVSPPNDVSSSVEEESATKSHGSSTTGCASPSKYSSLKNGNSHVASVAVPTLQAKDSIIASEKPFEDSTDFNMPLELATDLRFRPSIPPLSMTFKRRKGRPDGTRRKAFSSQDSMSSSEESDSEHLDSVEHKRRSRSIAIEVKRRKRDSLKGCD